MFNSFFVFFFPPILFSPLVQRFVCLICLPGNDYNVFHVLEHCVYACDNRAERIHKVTSSVKWLEIKVYRNKTEKNWSACRSLSSVFAALFPSLFPSFGHIISAPKDKQFAVYIYISRQPHSRLHAHTGNVASQNTNKTSTGTVKCRPKIDLTENWIKK